MVAIIRCGTSLRRAFHYNENKQKEGKATLLSAENYPLHAGEITAGQRINMLLKTAGLKPEVKVNSLHISLNFDPSEQLSDRRMMEIAKAYMDKIGFGQQPYLVYRHYDSGHPHCHIVTTNACLDGTSIRLHNIGKMRSEPARKQIEQLFNLVRAEEQGKKVFATKAVDAQIVRYGKTETRRAIAAVLGKIIDSYKYGSLAELNAVLRLYNVEAFQGSDKSRTYKNNGLLYRVLDDKGKPVGVPIKASLFHNKPTLKTLEKKFLAADIARYPHKEKLKAAIDIALFRNQNSFRAFTRDLLTEGIRTVCRYSKEGNLYGITYIDTGNRCVFNGSALGKQYSAKAISERYLQDFKAMLEEGNSVRQHQEALHKESSTVTPIQPKEQEHDDAVINQQHHADTTAWELLSRAEFAAQAVPYQWRKKKKKKKRTI